MNLVLDYSWGRPDPTWMKRANITGVLRYLCDSPGSTGKKLTPEELNALLNAGLSVAAIWQETVDAPTKGETAGKRDGQRAREAMKNLRAPAGAAVYFAADSEKVTAKQAASYLAAARPVLAPYRVGLYGGIDVITGTQKILGEASAYWWQTAAWSGSRISTRLHLYQGLHRGNFGGHQVDGNTAYGNDWGQFTQLTN
ncbi:glycoside hydrolase domain-containing protein [Streptomyces sp. NPDC000927]|uniref:glycoside hydrolase domain-containing protein n=1 Tax=Streptomyces sp. NPDC000927 TaxID=3154371 RepID=UPI00331F4712